MAGAISVLLLLTRLFISIHVKVILFLIKHFEITNGLIVALWVSVFTRDIKMYIWIRITMLAVIVAGSIVLQYFFKPARIIYGIISSLFGGLIAYGIFQDSGTLSPCIPFVIATFITGALNVLCWVRIGLAKRGEEAD